MMQPNLRWEAADPVHSEPESSLDRLVALADAQATDARRAIVVRALISALASQMRVTP